MAAVPPAWPLGGPGIRRALYLVLSLVAKSALAWQVYAGALAGG